MHQLQLVVDSEFAHICFDALKHERAPNASITFYLEGGKLVVNVAAKHISHLRAAGNSVLQWLAMTEKIASEIHDYK